MRFTTPHFRFLLAALLTLALPIATLAQTTPKEKDPRFPNGSKEQTQPSVNEALKKLPSNLSIGKKVGNQFGAQKNKNGFPDHPWKKGRKITESSRDWIMDSLNAVGLGDSKKAKGGLKINAKFYKKFMQCFEPRLVKGFCSHCYPPMICPDSTCSNYCGCQPNTGYVWEYWWPEIEVETNNYGIAAFNPVYADPRRADLTHKALEKMLVRDKRYKDLPKPIGKDPNLGQSAVEGFLPGEQFENLEAHTYETNVQAHGTEERCEGCGKRDLRYYPVVVFGECIYCEPDYFWYNGYKKGNNECFYDTLDKKKSQVRGFTEEKRFSEFWRAPEMSAVLDKDLYRLSSPAPSMPGFGTGGADATIRQMKVANKNYWKNRSCAAYRAHAWPDEYQDLTKAAGIVPYDNSDMEAICYHGGGDLFPITGTLMGHFHPLTSSVYIARRALYLFSHDYMKNVGGEDLRLNFFTDKVDKMQIVYPIRSECFTMDDVNDRDTSKFPPDAVRPNQNGSIRMVYWNKRQACTCQFRGMDNPKKSEGRQRGPLAVATTSGDPDQYNYIQQGWGCMIDPRKKVEQGHGDEHPDKVRGRAIKKPPLQLLVAESALQLYPFVGLPSVGGGGAVSGDGGGGQTGGDSGGQDTSGIGSDSGGGDDEEIDLSTDSSNLSSDDQDFLNQDGDPSDDGTDDSGDGGAEE